MYRYILDIDNLRKYFLESSIKIYGGTDTQDQVFVLSTKEEKNILEIMKKEH